MIVFLLAWFVCLPSWSQPPGTPAPISIPLDPDSAPRAPIPDSARPEEAVKLSAHGDFSVHPANVGDTVDYRLRVEWKDMRVPVVVLAPESLETPGFRLVGQSAEHNKTVANGEVRNVTEFTYRLIPKAPGNARVASLKLRYMTGFSNREEVLYVPGALLDVVPAHVPLASQKWFQLLLGLLLLTALGFAGITGSKAMRAKRRQALAAKNRDFSPGVKALKGRWNTADSRVWIEDAERVCLDYLHYQLGAEADGAARFEQLLDRYLSQSPTKASGPEEIEGWGKLRDLFHHARYAGGGKEPHELQNAYRILKTCLHLPGESES